ncbi:hypothetical protein Lal_00033338 [Lupinus albus]|uniref:RING-type E3 ubiquitin transferase n=1 Tax=Lupinus albus TaxID=3870 RepID=A0A6A5N940_LUPAL|nr:putative aminoacyltransferase, E1 ubiquitin-activating enzyme [Lupinus albus]KAF1879680.1 hypothetical protein Lal_00033338 [Lupinus albus]
MENDMEGVYWCNICSKMVNPMNEGENKCPICETEFSDVMESLRGQNHDSIADLRSTWVFSLYAPIFLGLMGAFIPSLASITTTTTSQGSSSSGSRGEEEVEQERENNELVLQRRRRASTSMMQLFRGLHVRMMSESDNPENNRNMSNNNNNMLVIDPFNDSALILRGPNLTYPTSSPNENVVGSLSDFLVGSGLDLLLEHLAQNSPSGYASVNPPALKAAIEAMPNVINEEKLQCTVCLEDLEIGKEAKEMPCKHKFHGDCIISWLKLHSSCPICRFRMPSEDSAVEANMELGNEGNQNNEMVRAREERVRNRRTWFPRLESFNNFLPSP